MAGSGTIRVVKADESVELFDVRKLAVGMYRAMHGEEASYEQALSLAEAVEIYLRRRGKRRVSSSAVFEMVLRSLRYVDLTGAAEAAEAYRDWRKTLRKQLRVMHDGRNITLWDKGWLCEFACRSWHISRATARILAGKAEMKLLRSNESIVTRQAVTELLNRLMSEYGLADAVPVSQ